jgi:hypothetical protein
MSKEQIKAQVRDDEGWDAFPYEDHLGFLFYNGAAWVAG